MEQVLAAVRSFDGVLVLTPGEGDGSPPIAWGDSFFYYAPDGQVPRNEQPYGTIVTKDYPGDTGSGLDAEGRWRVNIHVGRRRFEELIGVPPRELAPGRDFAAADVVLPHPVYGHLGWVSVVNPAERTMPIVLGLLRDAHERATVRWARHGRR